ncbi:DUF4148 domain-containing protein [Roseateles terrae]|uniref:DUF4148 domain-containing protein n=1 Tax=Roseateles terrae TaxID=431060 RepID=A0ABR6GSZ6_9BURK|nr:DUF4148 domain-containing protein [Roseateles terrae]MBB3195190.1 hypothetical protein [Roseateles terrae]OWQ87208.1 hypothetical protein CDN98_10200 [Roseateles terrae]
MNKFSATALIAAVLLGTTGAAFAAEPAAPTAKTRAEVLAELQAARESGEVAALSAEQAGVGALSNGVNAPTASQIAARKAAEKAVVAKKGAASEGVASK